MLQTNLLDEQIKINFTECIVCLDPLPNSNNKDIPASKHRQELECGHNDFHASCLTKWLKVNKNCPMCRKDVTV